MYFKIKTLRLSHTFAISCLVVLLFIISSFAVVQTIPHFSSVSDNSNNSVPNLANYLNELAANSPSLTSANEATLKNVIFKYTSLQEKNAFLQYVNKNGKLVDVLVYMPYILAQIPLDQYYLLKNHNANILLDKRFQVLPKAITSTTASVPINPAYKPPVDQINGTYLTKDKNLSGTGINIAVIDSGIDFTHPDLQGKNATVYSDKSFVTKANGYLSDENTADLNGHGTHVAGLAAGTGKASNGLYIGVAPGANLFNLKVVDETGSATESGILEAIDYALNPAYNIKIITMSLGFQGSFPDDPVSLSLDNAVNNHGMVVTVSAGNSGPGIGTVATPGSARSVITVGASYWENDTATFFSSRGPNSDYRYDPDVLAPGWFEVSTLASGSLIQQSEQYYSPTYIQSFSSGSYIPESGTSMAAPVVAGSVALLLQAFPNASPQSIRAALMSTAVNTGQPEYVQGAGFINVTAAYLLLQKEHADTSSTTNIISLLPQRSIFPNDPTLYPGDQLKVNLQFVAGAQSNIGISFSNQTFADIISYNHSDNSLTAMASKGYYGELLLTLTVPLNPKPGYYTSTLTVITDFQNFNLTIGPFNVKVPSKVLAWNIWYNTDSGDTPTGNYQSLATYLETQNITLDVINKPVDLSWIYQYNTIIFPDNELSISQAGISLLKDYINNGGNVIILSSFYPFSDISNYNELTQSYGINILNSTDMNIIDSGLSQTPIQQNESMSLTSFQNFNQLTGIRWYGGTHLQVDTAIQGTTVIGKIDSSSTPVIAGFTGNTTSRGQLFVFGSEYWFYNDFFNSVDQSLAKEFYNYVVNSTSPFLNMVALNNQIPLSDSWNATIFAGSSSGLFDNTANLAITLTGPGVSESLIPTTTSESFGQNITYPPSQPGSYQVNITYGNQHISSNFTVYSQVVNFTAILVAQSKPVNVPYYLTDTGVPVVDKGTTVEIGMNTDFKLLPSFTVDAIITLVPEFLQEYTGLLPTQNEQFTQEITLKQAIPGNTTYYAATFDTSKLNVVGFYFVDFEFPQGNRLFTGDFVNVFFVSEPNPSIDSHISTINGQTFSNYDVTASNPNVLTVNPCESISISLKASTLVGNGTVFVLFVPLYPFLDTQEIIAVWQINSTDNSLFNGKFTLPTATSMDSYGRTLNYADSYYTAFFILLRDQNGNYDVFPIVSVDKSNLFGPFNMNDVVVFFFFVVIPGAIVLIYYMKSRNKRKQQFYNYNYNMNMQQNRPANPMYPPPYTNQPPQTMQQEEINFCPYCGSSLVMGSNFCMECGKKIK